MGAIMARTKKLSQEDKILQDIVDQAMSGQQEPMPMHPDEMQRMLEMENNQPDISVEEMHEMSNIDPEEIGLFDEMGQMTGDNEEDEKAEEERDFFKNFVDDLDEVVKKKIAGDLCQKVQADLDSRKGWEDSIASTMKTLGIAQNIDKDNLSVMPFEGASTVEFPMLIRAAVQYVSRSVPEIIPNKPAKAILIGDSSPEREAQIKRVEDAINYQLTFLDKGFYNDYRKGEFYKAICGSIFRKGYHDPITNQNLTRLVKPQDFIIHYEQVDLESCNRYTHRMFMSSNEVRKMQHYGIYADVDIGTGTYPYDRDPITKEIDRMDGFDIARANAEGEEFFHTIYEVHCNLDIEGYEDLDEHGEETGIEIPYIVTLDKDSTKILSIRRNWKPDDPRKNKQTWFVHYQFLPGTGFYGFGYAHLIGSLARATTNIMRAILDGTALHLLKGGFKTEDAKIDGDMCISPGEFRTLQGTYDDIRKALYPMEFSAPSPIAIQMMQYMDQISKEVVANTEVMLGSASNQGPVGTTLALIEQSTKVYSSIHQATHRSFGEELRILAKLNFEYFPEKFEFANDEGANFVMREDFDDNIRVIPVSDPNISSFQQRAAIDEATLQLAAQYPQYFKMDKVIRRVMTNLNIPSIDEIMFTDEELQEQQAAEQEAQQEEIANMPDPVQDELEIQKQKIDGDLAKEQMRLEGDLARDQMKFNNEVELKEIEHKQNDKMAESQDLMAIVRSLMGGKNEQSSKRS